jgi:hypothetical protein
MREPNGKGLRLSKSFDAMGYLSLARPIGLTEFGPIERQGYQENPKRHLFGRKAVVMQYRGYGIDIRVSSFCGKPSSGMAA